MAGDFSRRRESREEFERVKYIDMFSDPSSKNFVLPGVIKMMYKTCNVINNFIVYLFYFNKFYFIMYRILAEHQLYLLILILITSCCDLRIYC